MRRAVSRVLVAVTTVILAVAMTTRYVGWGASVAHVQAEGPAAVVAAAVTGKARN